MEDDLKIDSIISIKSDPINSMRSFAKHLMNEYAISNGINKYRILELEFYIYDAEKWPDDHVYPRNAKAGQLFFHKNGFDICFKSDMEQHVFGGILIRALEYKNKDGEVIHIVGPIMCAQEILNSASVLPCLIHNSSLLTFDASAPLTRVGIHDWSQKDYKDNFYNSPQRFIRAGIRTYKERRIPWYNFVKRQAYQKNIKRNIEGL